MSLYFKVPQPDRDRLRPLVRLMLQLIFNRLMEQLDPDRHHLLLMLDEFPELKKIPNLAAAMSLMAGYKIKPYLIAQTLTQIIEEYGPNESITDNCYIKAAFQTDNLQTCKNLSELSGNMTVEKETVNYSGQRTDFYLKHIFRSVEQVQRPLITVDEIRRIKPPTKATNDPNSKITAPGEMLIFINGVAPIYGVQSLYFLNDTLLARTKLKPPVFPTAAQPRPAKPLRLHLRRSTSPPSSMPLSRNKQLRSRSMEIVNQVMLAGNLTDQPYGVRCGRPSVCARPAGAALALRHPGKDRGASPIPAHHVFRRKRHRRQVFPERRQHPRHGPAHPPRTQSAGRCPERQPAKAAPSSRSTSFGPSASRPAPNPSQRLSTKTKSAAQTTPNKYLHSFRKASMIGPFSRLIALRSSHPLPAEKHRRCVRSGLCLCRAHGNPLRLGFQLHALRAISDCTAQSPDPANTPRNPAPYVFFCPDVRWPTMKGQPNYRTPMRSCPDGFAPLIKPVVAWPGDTVETSARGVSVNGHLLPHTATMDQDSSRRQILPFPAGKYLVQKNQLWVVSSFSPRSFDSRYFGPIPLNSVRSWIRPLLVERSYHPSSIQIEEHCAQPRGQEQ